ncbi:MAG: hypothetical protein F6K26_54715 [Moorea sp. SIO2I5]|nr:hypothetical protein [Moorena sp. SIO2I5]
MTYGQSLTWKHEQREKCDRLSIGFIDLDSCANFRLSIHSIYQINEVQS